jgi:hypothetical protein
MACPPFQIINRFRFVSATAEPQASMTPWQLSENAKFGIPPPGG